ncbi:hypothetical protein D0911_02815 [Zhongshania marina]|uniref:Phage integrase family protein n=1 Tax=Zhongshania marina TaxID=2304603 RepID=A0ABX9W696_9GAMM|nr:hypothetical protein D0911_02815 [Zhongshania marina]
MHQNNPLFHDLRTIIYHASRQKVSRLSTQAQLNGINFAFPVHRLRRYAAQCIANIIIINSA